MNVRKDGHGMKAKNGFSLVELMIVIGIMAVVVGFMSLGLWYVFAADTESLAQSINSGLTSLKSENTSKSAPTYMHFYLHNGDYYIAYTDSDTFADFGTVGKKIGGDNVSVSCDGTAIAEDTDIVFGIRRKDGAFSSGPKLITCSQGDDIYSVHIVQSTGKHFVKNDQ